MTLALAFLGVVGVAFGVFLPAGLSWGGAFLLLGLMQVSSVAKRDPSGSFGLAL